MDAQGGSRIAIDAMGSDAGPAEMVAAARLAIESIRGLEPLALVGQEDLLRKALRKEGLEEGPKVSICHASEVIAMDDKPLHAIKRKADSSMVRAVDLVKAGQAKVALSCGNTGALMAAGTLKLRTLEGVARPALATVMPRNRGHCVLIDGGANPTPKAEHLMHNAVLGSNYAKLALGIPEPRVGLLTIGTEEGKGTDLINETHNLLQRLSPILRYEGPIEGFQIFEDQVDVIVCDGFTGNVVLKACESLFKLLKNFAAEEIRRSPVRMLGYALAKGAFDAMKRQISPERYGGAPLLGLRGNILKAHGSSCREAVRSAIRIAHEMISQDLTAQIVAEIERANALVAAEPAR